MFYLVYYDLDSKVEKAKLIGNEESLIEYLDNVLQSKEKELFIVISKEIEQNQEWKK